MQLTARFAARIGCNVQNTSIDGQINVASMRTGGSVKPAYVTTPNAKTADNHAVTVHFMIRRKGKGENYMHINMLQRSDKGLCSNV